ncbi:MAG: PEGA domain-containing protein [Deltaproteobacteria bacterium]
MSDSSWESPEAVERKPAGFDVAKASRSASGDDDPPVYGVGVPYGGNEMTEEVEPIALDMPFSPESDVLTPPVITPALVTPRREASIRAPSAASRDSELKPPVTQLVLSDLFDSTPPPPGSSMEPPDPAAFSTSRPPPARGFQALRRSKAREPKESSPPPAAPWGASSQNAELKYFSGGFAPSSPAPSSPAPSSPAPSSPAAPSGPAPNGPAARASSPVRPYPSGAATSSGFPGEASAQPSPAFVRSSEPITSGGVVALPSINVLAEPPFPRPDTIHSRPERSRPPGPSPQAVEARVPPPGAAAVEVMPVQPPAPAEPASPVQSTVSEVGASEAAANELAASEAALIEDTPVKGAPVEATTPVRAIASEAAGSESSAASAAPQPSPEPAGQRRSVDTLESVSNTGTRPKRNGASKSNRPRPAAAAEVARFPSDVPTSRPPDVLLEGESEPPAQPSERKSSPGGRARSSAPSGPRRSSNPPPQSVLAALPSTKTGQIALPSVMLGSDVEAEPDSATLRRAQRAARATVRIELPEGFGRPGSALSGLSPRGASTALPLPEPEPAFRSLPLKRMLPWAIGGLVVLALCLAFVLRPRSGSLVVTALGAGHRAVESVQIFVDGVALCDSSPCRISGLTAGNHQLRARAPGLSSGAEQIVEITAGEEAATNIELSSVEPEARAGALRVAAGEKELTLFVDDRRVGKLPQTVSGLPSGRHWLKLDAEDGSPPIERAVSVSPGETVDVDPKPVKRDKVVVTIRLSPESEGASVTFDDAFLLDFPAELELDPNSTHTLSATKPGYEDFTLHLEVGEEAGKQVEVTLTPLEGSAHRPRPRPSATGAFAPAVRRPAAASRPAAGSPAVDPTQGLLNISSVPPSQIILNGRPMGSTPKTAVVVPGDSLQTIVFVHPKMGRRRAQKFVPAGKERTVSIRF